MKKNERDNFSESIVDLVNLGLANLGYTDKEKAKERFNKINRHECDCTHICNVGSSMQHSFKNIFFDRIFVDSIKQFKYFK